MNVWRLIAHHDYPASEAEYYRRESLIAVGWGGTGNLNQRSFQDVRDLTKIVDAAHPISSSTNCVHGGRSLWHLYKGVQIGDLVIVSVHSKRVMTMQVTENYYFVGDEGPDHYEHRRRTEAVPIDANRLWQISGGMATGENIRRTLIRCARPITEAEFKELVG